jgi:hypothetical protein
MLDNITAVKLEHYTWQPAQRALNAHGMTATVSVL